MPSGKSGKMRDAHWKLETLPPGLRQQVERQLGVAAPPPLTKETIARIASEFSGKLPQRNDSKIKGGMFKAAKANATLQEGDVLPNPAVQAMKRPELHKFDKAPRTRKTLTPDMAATLVKSYDVSQDGNEVKIVLGIDCYMLPTAQQKGAFVGKDGKVHFFTKSKVAKSEKALIKALSPYSEAIKKWGGAPVSLSIDFCFPFTKSMLAKHVPDYAYHINRPDVDNLAKSVIDSLTQSGFWTDDSIVSELYLRKFRIFGTPRIIILVKRLPMCMYTPDLFEGIL